MNAARLMHTTRSLFVAKQPRTATTVRGIRSGSWCVLLAALILAPELAMAAPWDSVATSVLGIFTGGLTRTIAIIAVIACGIAAIAGKLSWDWAIKIVVGIVLIFGSATLVDYVIAAAS